MTGRGESRPWASVAARAVCAVFGGIALVGGAAHAAGPSGPAAPGKLNALIRAELELWKTARDVQRRTIQIRAGLRSTLAEIHRAKLAQAEAVRRATGAERRIAVMERKLRRRVRALYFLVRRGRRRALFDPRRAAVARDGRRALLAVVKKDRDELSAVRAEYNRLASRVEAMRRRRREARAAYRELERQRDQFTAQIAHLRQRIVQAGRVRRAHRRRAGEWTIESSRMVREMVAVRTQLRQEAIPFGERRGRLARPVPGQILRWFGTSRLAGTKTSERAKGITIAALKGWKVHSPGPGVVRHAGKLPGYGQVVIIDHGEGYWSVLGYLRESVVQVGERVRQGLVVGEVDRIPGDGRFGAFFELRKDGRSIDPVPWIYNGLAELRRRGPARYRRGDAPASASGYAGTGRRKRRANRVASRSP